MSNPLVEVRGRTAIAKLLFTEVLIDKEGEAPHILTQGREYDQLVKVGGQWRIQKRQITGANQGPPDWFK